MSSIAAFIVGKKTYFVAFLAIAFASYQLYTQAIYANTFSQIVLAAAGLAGLRSGLTSTVVQAAGAILAAHPNPSLNLPTGVNTVADAVLQKALDIKTGQTAPGQGGKTLASILFAMFCIGMGIGLVACQTPVVPPAPQTVSQGLFEAETGLDVAVVQATAYASLPRCGATGSTSVCSDAVIVGMLLTDARQAQSYLLQARQAESAYLLLTSPTAADTAKVTAAVNLLTTALTHLQGEVPATKG